MSQYGNYPNPQLCKKHCKYCVSTTGVCKCAETKKIAFRIEIPFSSKESKIKKAAEVIADLYNLTDWSYEAVSAGDDFIMQRKWLVITSYFTEPPTTEHPFNIRSQS